MGSNCSGSIFKEKGDIRNCSFCRAVKLLEHGMNLVEKVLDKRLCRMCLLMKCNLALCLRQEHFLLCLS